MSDILSQAEIDSLLSALQSGEVDAEAMREEEESRKIRNYDFRRPDKFSKDQLNTIEVIYENFCRLFATVLSGTLRNRVIAQVASVDQVTYEEFVRSIPNPTILNIFSLPPLEGKGILEINPIISFSIIDRLFGGPGLSTVKGRPLTEIEKSVMERISEKILYLFKEAWSSLLDLEAMLETIEINPQFSQIISPQEMVVIITINTQIGEIEGFVNICIPCLMLEPISSKLNTKFWFTSSERSLPDEKVESLKNIVETTAVPVSAYVGKSDVTIRDIMGLQVGDVIPLDTNKNKDYEIYVGSRLKFFGRPGMLGNRLAVKITELHQEGSEANE